MQGRGTRVFVMAVLLAWLLASVAMAGQGPQVSSVTEGKDPASGRPVVDIWGKGLGTIVDIDLTDPSGPTLLETPTVLQDSNSRLTLGLPLDLPPGAYELALKDRKGRALTVAISIGNGKPLPGSVAAGALAAGLRADLDDAETLNGNAGTYYLDAGNLSGVLSTGLFSAYGDLLAEGKVGTGASQVAAGDHLHDARYSLLGHSHAEYATTTAVAAGYAPLNHNHDGTYAKKALIGAKVFRTSAFYVSSGSETIIPFDTEDFDTDNCHSSTTNPARLTCNSPGYYLVTGRVYRASSGYTDYYIRKNGGLIARFYKFDASSEAVLCATTIELLAQGDYLESSILQTGNDTSLSSGKGNTELMMVRIGE